MINYLLRLLAASTSFVVLLLVANTAIAAPQIDSALTQTINQPELRQFSLNVISPTLQLINQPHNLLNEHLGCSCADCIQAIGQTSNTI
ncbi:hypothetical protein [Pleurocapsa sp. PCC 7319]|uniref:hypothetical protein n=1 Tax=Pleurocapsa sp. PCC 7319 TaxID=118161 RepID=UPI00034DCE2D|nr:hypothetical protein [Pleurocapsa sp. PCC 7319]